MKTKLQKGFSLLEIIITVLIVAILGATAMSFFGDNVAKARCTEGRTAVLFGATVLEKCKSVYGVYNNANCNTADFLGATSENNFNVTMSSTATTFDLTATGQNSAAAAINTFCPTITLSHLGVQGGTGTLPWP